MNVKRHGVGTVWMQGPEPERQHGCGHVSYVGSCRESDVRRRGCGCGPCACVGTACWCGEGWAACVCGCEVWPVLAAQSSYATDACFVLCVYVSIVCAMTGQVAVGRW